MIKYSLKCSRAHVFDAWFRSGADCDAQLQKRQVLCPHCGDDAVGKSIMAPSISAGRSSEPEPARNQPSPPAPAAAPAPMATTPEAMRRMLEARLRALRSHVEATAEHVGGSFAVEARRIHDGEAEERPIYGQATPDEVEELLEDGVPCAPLPWIDQRDD